jgi:hypothetical protein
MFEEVQNLHLHENDEDIETDCDDSNDSEFDMNKSIKMVCEIRNEVNGVKKIQSSAVLLLLLHNLLLQNLLIFPLVLFWLYLHKSIHLYPF